MTEYKLKCRNIQQGIPPPNHIPQQQLNSQIHHDDEDSGDEDGDGGGED